MSLVGRGRQIGHLLPCDLNQLGLEQRLVHEVPEEPSALPCVGADCSNDRAAALGVQLPTTPFLHQTAAILVDHFFDCRYSRWRRSGAIPEHWRRSVLRSMLGL